MAPRLDHAIRRLTQEGDVTFDEIRALSEQPTEAVVHRVDLLRFVEDVGHVDRRVGDGAGELEHHRDARLHVGRTTSPQRVAFDPGRAVAVDRHGVGVAGEDESKRSASVRAGNQVVADLVDRQPGRRLELAADAFGDRTLVVALGRDANEFSGEGEQVGHRGPRSHRRAVVAQDRLELGLVVTLALVQVLDHEDAGQPVLVAAELA